MLRVYIETSVWSMAIPDQNPTLRGPTLQFLTQCRMKLFLPYWSDIILDELHRASPTTRRRVMRQVARIEPQKLEVTGETLALAAQFIEEGILSAKRINDARHVACAIVHEVDLVVSWNYRHIANVRKADAFRQTAARVGYPARTEIHTPLEVLG